MKIQVKVTGIIEDNLPPNSANPVQLDITAGVTPLDVVHRLRLPAKDRYLIAVNGEVVPHSEHGKFALSENDTIAIMTPLKGG